MATEGGQGPQISDTHAPESKTRKNDIQLENPQNWSIDDVFAWLRQEGFGACAPLFKEHAIDGYILGGLTIRDLGIVGIEKVGVRYKLREEIANLMALDTRRTAQSLKIPTMKECIKQLITFEWAETSHGKSGYEQKEELTTANLSISVVSAMLCAQTLQWYMSVSSDCFCGPSSLVYFGSGLGTGVNGTELCNPAESSDGCVCFCSTGYALENYSLRIFTLCCAVSATFFLLGTVTCILQIIAINEMSDEVECKVFFEECLTTETLAGQLVSLGTIMMLTADMVFTVSTRQLGITGERFYMTFTLILVKSLTIVFALIYVPSTVVRTVYTSKVYCVKRSAALAEKKKRKKELMRKLRREKGEQL